MKITTQDVFTLLKIAFEARMRYQIGGGSNASVSQALGTLQKEAAAADSTHDEMVIWALRTLISSELLGAGFKGNISIEGAGEEKQVISTGDEQTWVCIVPIDGIESYRNRNGSKIISPFSTCITVLSKKEGAKFSDILFSGMINLEDGDIWIAERLSSGFVSRFNGEIIYQDHDKEIAEIAQKNKWVVSELTSRQVSSIKMPEENWFRCSDASAYEMAIVALGVALVFVREQQSCSELGAGYALVKGAGGVAIDFDGNDLGEREYLFNAQTPVILAGNKSLAEDILARLNK